MGTEYTIEKELRTAAAAKLAVEWALAQEHKSQSASITAKMFTAFMFEGVVHRIGQVLDHDWETGEHPPARRPLEERHRSIRKLVGLANGGQDYQAIQTTVAGLIRFRDHFAHPKLLQNTRTVSEKDVQTNQPIFWEQDLSFTVVEQGFGQVLAYCQLLLDTAATLLESVDPASSAFQHIDLLEKTASELRAFLSFRWFEVGSGTFKPD